MDWNLASMLERFKPGDKRKLLLSGKWGLEKENLRVTSTGDLALTPHPVAFGDKLQNPTITVDFSESQLELVTPPLPSISAAYASLLDIQDRVVEEIGAEKLWPLSMPPRLPHEEKIPIATFSHSPQGRQSEIYRRGLALRYGKKMQMISGFHYNFSFNEEMLHFLYEQFGQGMDKIGFINRIYFAMSRNFLRYRWVLIYLFGASPTTDDTYYSVLYNEWNAIEKCCPELNRTIEAYKQYATSLRVSRFGYSNTLQGDQHVSFNSIEEHITSMRQLLTTQSNKYSQLGLYRNGTQVQLNSNVLQNENEFYSSIRLKQQMEQGETQLEALQKRGVEYVEIRLLDLNPFEKIGVGLSQLHFIHVFMLYCLFEHSPLSTNQEMDKMNRNHHTVSLFGRKPGQTLSAYTNDSNPVSFQQWIEDIFSKLRSIAIFLDQGDSEQIYRASVQQEYEKIKDVDLLPSQKIINEMEKNHEDYIAFGLRKLLHLNETY